MPAYKFMNVIAYVVNNSEAICPECLTDDDKITKVYDESDQCSNRLIIICDRCGKECVGSIAMWHKIVFDSAGGTVFQQVPGFDYHHRPGPTAHLQK